jgi:hypothetical protein
MKRSGGTAGRPFGHYSIEELEAHVPQVSDLSDLKAIKAECGFRTTKRAEQLENLVTRLIRSWTGSFDPDATGSSQR